MVLVIISSAGCESLDIETPDEDVRHFLPQNGTSAARTFLFRLLAAGYLRDRPEWDQQRIRDDLHISVPTLNLEYVLQELQDEQVIEVHGEEWSGQYQQQQDVEQSHQQQDVEQSHQQQDVEQSHQQEGVEQSQQQSKKKKIAKGFRWTHRATLRLIFHWKQRKARFNNNTERNEEIWEDLAAAMAAEGFTEVSSHNCENKFKYLKRTYIETKDINKKSTGQPEKSCPYYEEMDEIFKKSPQINPPSLASNIDGVSQITTEGNEIEIEILPTQRPGTSTQSLPGTSAEVPAGTSTETTISSQPPKKKTRLESSLSAWAEAFQAKSNEREAARQKRHDELVQLQRESNDIYKEIMTKLLDKL